MQAGPINVACRCCIMLLRGSGCEPNMEDFWLTVVQSPLYQKALQLNTAAGDSSQEVTEDWWPRGNHRCLTPPGKERQSTGAGYCEMFLCDITSCGADLKSKLCGCWMCFRRFPHENCGEKCSLPKGREREKRIPTSFLEEMRFKGEPPASSSHLLIIFKQIAFLPCQKKNPHLIVFLMLIQRKTNYTIHTKHLALYADVWHGTKWWCTIIFKCYFKNMCLQPNCKYSEWQQEQ